MSKNTNYLFIIRNQNTSNTNILNNDNNQTNNEIQKKLKINIIEQNNEIDDRNQKHKIKFYDSIQNFSTKSNFDASTKKIRIYVNNLKNHHEDKIRKIRLN
jgi:hypothetical protein